MVALVIVMGTVEFLGPGGNVDKVVSARTQLAEYESYCREHGLMARDLLG